jgi:hypothetical protein
MHDELNRLHERHRQELAKRQLEAEGYAEDAHNQTKAVDHGICTWDGQAHPWCGVRANCLENGACPHLIRKPAKGVEWKEKSTGARFLVKHVDTWKSGAVTIHAVCVPSRRIVCMPMNVFMMKFERCTDA